MALVCGGLSVAQQARAQSLDTIVSIGAGSGLSFGTGDGDTVIRRSPIFLAIEVGLIFDGDRSLEWTPALIFELDGRVSAGIDPRLKKLLYFGRFGLYGAVGVPVYFAPFTLFGLEAAVGGIFSFTRRLALALEVRVHAFFAGSDLPDDSALVKTDLALALRFEL